MKMTLPAIGLAGLLGAALLSGCRGGAEMADLVLVNGTVWTGQSGAPRAEALAVRGAKITAVGPSRDIKRSAGAGARVIDLGGALVLPGFIDSHAHFLDGGFALLSLKLRDASSRGEFVSRIAQRA